MRLPHPSHSRRNRDGNVLVLVVVCLFVLVGILAVALDGGLLMTERRHAQATADAAALAGAAELYKNYWRYSGADPGGPASQSALAYAAANGYTNDGVTSVV